MKHIEILEQHYDFAVNSKNKKGFADLTIEYIVVGKKSEVSSDNLITTLNELFKVYFMDQHKKDMKTEDFIYVSYITNKSEKNKYYKATQHNWNDTITLLNEEKVQNIQIKNLDNIPPKDSVVEEELFGNTNISLQYRDFEYYYNEQNFKTYEIRLTILYSIYDFLTINEKLKFEKLWIESFCKLNALCFLISHHKDFSENIEFIPLNMSYENAVEEHILGCYWCNVLSESFVRMLGGFDKAKKLLKQFILEEFCQENGKKALFIKLCEEDNKMNQEDIKSFRNVFLPFMLPAEKDRLNRAKYAVELCKGNDTAYKARLQVLLNYEFACKYILLLEEDDPRWT